MDDRTVQPRQDSTSTAILLLMVQFVVSCALGFTIYFMALSTAGCDADCDYEVLGATFIGYPLALAALFLSSIIGVIVLSKRGRGVLIPPLVGIGVASIGAAVAYALVAGSLP